MDVASICLIIFFVIFALIGFKKGFIDALITTFKGAIIMGGSLLLSKPMGKVFFNTGLASKLCDKISTMLLAKNYEIFSQVVTVENSKEQISSAFSAFKIPEFFHDIINNLLGKYVSGEPGDTLANYFGKTLAFIVCVIIAYFVVMLLLTIIVSIIRKTLKGINHIPVIGIVNCLLGVVFELVLAGMVVCTVFWICASIASVSIEFSDLMTRLLALDSESGGFAKWLYEHNIAVWFFNKLMNK